MPLSAPRMRARSSASPRAAAAASVDLGGGVRATVEYGIVRFGLGTEAGAAPEPVELPVPGTLPLRRLGGRAARATPAPGPDLGSPTRRASTPDRLAGALTVRAWRDGDRMQPLGLDGTKSLQDLFSDRKVPRSLRHSLPVVESGGEIAWVAGVAVSERFKIGSDTDTRLEAIARACRTATGLSGLAPLDTTWMIAIGVLRPYRLGIGSRSLPARGVHDGSSAGVQQVGETIVEADELQRRVAELGAQITADYAGRELFLMGVLKGAVFFLADLCASSTCPASSTSWRSRATAR